jgi:hydrophobic/amphiphilic exporter-1 (mainly G- bacteria), HAE1 family
MSTTSSKDNANIASISKPTGLIFALAIVIVFLVLAAQYESYTDPLIILLTVPLAILGAMTAIWIRSNILMVDSLFPKVVDDIYCQVGLVTLIGLAAKNAILVVEFANQLSAQGMSYTRAAIKAGEERFRKQGDPDRDRYIAPTSHKV